MSMQFLKIENSLTLEQLSDRVGDKNVDAVLSENSLTRQVNIGSQYNTMCENTIANSEEVTWQRKTSLLNRLVDDSEIFENVALLDENGWSLYSSTGILPGTLKLPSSVQLPDSADIIGNDRSVSDSVYSKAMSQLKESPHEIDPSIFNSFSTAVPSIDASLVTSGTSNPFQMFQIPWGQVSLYSSLGGDSIDFPVYPEEISDGVSANYTQMPDMLYQYEPWQVYESSGPRSNTYTFKFHRDMWTGDHTDGRANELIRFCEANCYPEFSGSAVRTSTVTLYIAGTSHITGVLTQVSPRWSGPIGSDGWYLVCELELSITEVSDTPLNYSTVRNKGLIG